MSFVPFGLISFALFGSLLVIVGASQGEIRASLDLDLTQSGLLVSAIMSGIALGVAAGGPLADRLPRRPLFAVAAGATGIGFVALGPEQSFSSVFALLVVAGAGGGLYETILNAAAVERYREESVRMVSLLHSAACLGAIATPPIVGWLVYEAASPDWTLSFRVAGTAHLGLAALCLATDLGTPALGPGGRSASPERIVTAPLLFLCLGAFAYVGIEASISAMAVPYAEVGLDLEANRGRNAISFFWLGLLSGRLLFVLRSASANARLAALASGIAGLTLILGVVLEWHALEAFFAALGFALSFVFPLLVALAGTRTPSAPATGVALVAGIGSGGGFVAPWLVGAIGDAKGVAFAFGTLAAWCTAVAVATVLAEAFTARSATEPRRVRR
jgi:fucose permease